MILFHGNVHVDINECHERTDGCHQKCVNTNGSYTCDCQTGYRIASDGYTCTGIFKSFAQRLLFWKTSLFQTLMSAVRGLIGVTRTAIMLMVLMHVAVTVAIVLMEMDLPAMVVLWFQYTGAF